MKPLRIEISNFGVIERTVIDLQNVTIAAIAGPNGAGKSTAFTIAPMFALFGTTKPGTSADDMVRCGSTEAAVTFDFDHQGATYRVIRTRSIKGRGKSTLELQRAANSLLPDGSIEWTSCSGASIAETQKKIIDLLNLDAETFAASSMILQGDAGNFTSRPAGQRKAILAQILQLDQYDVLQDKARAKVQEANVALAGIKAQITAIEERLEKRAAIAGDQLVYETQLRTLAKKLAQAEQDLTESQMELATLQAKIDQAAALGKRIESLKTSLQTKTAERDRQQQRRDNAQKSLAQEPDILAAAAESDALRDEITALNVKKSQQNTLFQEANRLKTESTQIESSLSTVDQELAKLHALLAKSDDLLAQKAEYDMAIGVMESMEQQRLDYESLQRQLLTAESDLKTAEIRRETESDGKRKEIKSLEERAAMLDNAHCIDIERANCAFLSDAKEARAKAQRLHETFDAWYQAELLTGKQLQKKVAGMREILSGIGFSPEAYTATQATISRLRPAVEEAAKLDSVSQLIAMHDAQREELQQRLADVNKRLTSMREQYKELSAGIKDLPAKQERFNSLQALAKLKDTLPAAKEALSSATEQLDTLATEMDQLTEQLTTAQQEHTLIIGNAASLHQAAQERLNELQTMVESHRAKQNECTTNLGAIKAKLDALDDDEIEKVKLQQEMEPLAKRLTRWQTLVKAFGRDGIQALILENAVPELERTANDILSQMSGGKNYLRFETQKELKSRSGMAETLDIIVGDWAGERIYETYSGGEQLRIDFAIRFALAEMLARRAGAKVDWLTIDEGFGSQSDEYLPMVIQAVQNVANRFGLVLVISHVKAVQEAFSEKIEFWPPAQEGETVQIKVA